MGRFKLGNVGIMLILFFATQGCAADGRQAGTVILTGTIRVVGNEPFTHLVLTLGEDPEKATRDQDFQLVGSLAEELRSRFQRKKVTLEGTSCTPTAAGFTKCLNPVKIIDVAGKPGK